MTAEVVGKTVVTVGVEHGADLNRMRQGQTDERRQENEPEACYLVQK